MTGLLVLVLVVAAAFVVAVVLGRRSSAPAPLPDDTEQLVLDMIVMEFWLRHRGVDSRSAKSEAFLMFQRATTGTPEESAKARADFSAAQVAVASTPALKAALDAELERKLREQRDGAHKPAATDSP